MARLSLGLTPRTWQREALDAWKAAGNKGVVEVVTGGGKTVFAELCMQEIAESNPDACFLVVVPTIALLDQWCVSLQEEAGLADSDIALWSGRGKPDDLGFVNLMVINTARSEGRRISEAGSSMLIVDECHRAGSPINALALGGSHVATLGMSATPEREGDTGFEERIAPALGRIVYRYDLDRAGKDGVVSPFDLVNVRVDLLEDEEREYRRLSQRIAQLIKRASAEVEASERLKLLSRKRARVSALATMRIPVAVRLVDQHRGERAMVFHESIEDAEQILGNLRKRGHSATIYHSRISPTVRRDNLRLYRCGAFDVLISCRALDEGINIPETRVAVIASATASNRQRIQRLGRVLRPARGKERAIVYTLYATDIEESRLLKESARVTSAETIRWQKSTMGDGKTSGTE